MWSVSGPENAGKVQTSADVGTAAAMWMPVRLAAGCSRRPVQQRQKHGRRLSNAVRRPTSAGRCRELMSGDAEQIGRAMEAAVHEHR